MAQRTEKDGNFKGQTKQGISSELLGPQKSFTYQNMQNSECGAMVISIILSTQKLLLKILKIMKKCWCSFRKCRSRDLLIRTKFICRAISVKMAKKRDIGPHYFFTCPNMHSYFSRWPILLLVLTHIRVLFYDVDR